MFQSHICITCCNATCIKHVCVCKHVSGYISDPPNQISLTLNGNQGNEVVHETQKVTFDCTAGDGRPTPTVRLVSRANGTEVHSELSPLTYSVMARCEDSGVYVCTARNGMGTQEVSVNASLTVQTLKPGVAGCLSILLFQVDMCNHLVFLTPTSPLPHTKTLRGHDNGHR